jgi:hypothetical protein
MTDGIEAIQRTYEELLAKAAPWPQGSPAEQKAHWDQMAAEEAESARLQGAPPPLRWEPPESDPVKVFQTIVDGLQHRVEHQLNHLNRSLHLPYLIRAFPLGKVNACATPASGGGLILINMGVMMMLHQSIKALVWRTRLGTLDDGTFDDDATSRMLAEILGEYLIHDYTTAAHRQPWVAGPRLEMVNEVRDAAEAWIIAHELGHLALGHLSGRRVTLRTLVGNVHVIERTRQEEHEADDFATEVVMSCWTSGCPHSSFITSRFGGLSFFAPGVSVGAGIVVLMRMTDMIHEILQKVWSETIVRTHPSGHERIERQVPRFLGMLRDGDRFDQFFVSGNSIPVQMNEYEEFLVSHRQSIIGLAVNGIARHGL